MKSSNVQRPMKSSKVLQAICCLLSVLLLSLSSATADVVVQTPVNLGSTSGFAVLAGSGVTNAPACVITGDVGLSPAAESLITGFSQTDYTGYALSPQVTGKIYAASMADPTPANLTTAKGDLTLAYNDAAGRTPVPTGPFLNPGSGDLAGLTLAPGLYKFTGDCLASTDFALSGTATDVWIFQIATALTVSNGVQVTLAGGAKASNIFWQVGSSAILGTTVIFHGTIMADQSVTLQTGATLNGRALASSALVALDTNTITVPPITYRLTLKSVSPNTSVSIMISPLDNAGQGNGLTDCVLGLTRDYDYSTTVTLTAALFAPDGNSFYRWLVDGAEFAGNQSRTVQVLMTTTCTMTAIYHSNQPILTIASQNPDNGINIFVYPADVTGQTRGTTQFTCQYPWRYMTTLSAPPSLPGGWVFSKWLKDGANFPSNTYRNVLCSMDTDHTMTAVFAHPYNTSILTVASSSPVSGAVVSVYPADKNNQTVGTTQFVCLYAPNSMVTLTARGKAPNGFVFSKWLRDGADFPNNAYRDVLCSMVTDRTMTAVYTHPYNTALLTVASSSPISGAFVSVYPPDKYNQTTGTTQFICSYVQNSMVTLTARGTAPNGYVFSKWLKDGADFANNTYRDVLCSMGADHTMTAVYKP